MISLKVIMPKELWFSPSRLEKAINKALDSAALGAKADFELTIATWEHKPSFQITKDGFKRLIFTRSEIYKDLNDGTKERHVIMTPGFQAKTIPHKLTSRVGKGGVLAFTKKPMPGIEARQWTIEVQKKWQAELPKIIQEAINAAVTGK